jgi:hypothetical protein
MKRAAAVVVAFVLTFAGQVTLAQELSRYRDYVLGLGVDAVVMASGAQPTDVKTMHQRPAAIQRLLWRAPYVRSSELSPDPVRDVAFSFYDDALYQVVVNYDRQRTSGLTNSDVVESLSATYGPAVPASAKTRFDVPSDGLPGSIAIARWQSADTLLTLLRVEDEPEFQLVLESKAVGARARRAIRESVRLDTLEAPRRDLERRTKEASDADRERDKARVTNRAAFRP